MDSPAIPATAVRLLTAELFNPNGLATDPTGNVYIADAGNSRIREVTFPAPAATPAFGLAAGTYVGIQTIAIADTTHGATIYYSQDGTQPTPASSVYSAPISPSVSATVRAIAVVPGYTTSSVGSAAYVIQSPAVPSIIWATPAPIPERRSASRSSMPRPLFPERSRAPRTLGPCPRAAAIRSLLHSRPRIW